MTAGPSDDAAYWDEKFRRGGHIWGDEPGELATLALDRLRTLRADPATLTLLDLGCGYGRDSVVLWRALGLSIVAVDGAARAIEMARAARPRGARIDYRCADLAELTRDRPRVGSRQADGEPLGGSSGRFDAVFCANLWQVLRPAGRATLAAVVRDRLASGGLLLLNALSTRDPQHAGRGRPVPGDPGSCVEGHYLHLSGRDELAAAFAFLEIERLDELAYTEERPGGAPHHHVSWVLVARAR